MKKKKILAIVLATTLALSLGLVMAVPAGAHVEGAPQTATLYAGQDIDVGTVTVWNDATTLYVKYQTTGGWEMTETHLEVADTLAGIPQTTGGKKGKGTAGNPIPGHFSDGDYYDPPVTEDTFEFDIIANEWEPCETDLDIAAHAAVRKLSDPIPASLASGAGTDSVLVIAEDTGNLDYPIGYPPPYGGTPTPSVVIQGTPAAYSGWPTITGAQWISDSLANPGSANSWRLFTRDFSIPSNATNISGTLHIDSDNAEEAKINGSPAAGLVDGTVYGAVIGQPQEWVTVLSHPVGSYLQPGPNTLQVMVRNYYWVPTPGMWNYTGLIYKMDYEYQLLFTETAWGDGTRFTPKGNWATYFEYHVQPFMVLEASDDATAAWETTETHSGDYSVYLSVPTVDDYAEVYLDIDLLPGDIALSAINRSTTSFWCKSIAGDYIPYFIFEIEGVAGDFTGYGYPTATRLRINNDAASSAGYTSWAQFVASSATTDWQWAFLDAGWNELGGGWDSWANLVSTYGTEIVDAVLVENSAVMGSYPVSAYVDDITVNGVNYGPD